MLTFNRFFLVCLGATVSTYGFSTSINHTIRVERSLARPKLTVPSSLPFNAKAEANDDKTLSNIKELAEKLAKIPVPPTDKEKKLLASLKSEFAALLKAKDAKAPNADGLFLRPRTNAGGETRNINLGNTLIFTNDVKTPSTFYLLNKTTGEIQILPEADARLIGFDTKNDQLAVVVKDGKQFILHVAGKKIGELGDRKKFKKDNVELDTHTAGGFTFERKIISGVISRDPFDSHFYKLNGAALDPLHVTPEWLE